MPEVINKGAGQFVDAQNINFAAKMKICLLCLFLSCCRLVSSQVAIGFISGGDRDGVFFVMEDAGAAERQLCVAANFSSETESEKSVRIAYMSRGAIGKLIELTMGFYNIYFSVQLVGILKKYRHY